MDKGDNMSAVKIVKCGNCHWHGSFDTEIYGVIGYICIGPDCLCPATKEYITGVLSPVSGKRAEYPLCYRKNKNNDCMDHQTHWEWFISLIKNIFNS